MAQHRVTMFLINDHIVVIPLTIRLNSGDEIIWEIGAEPNDTVWIGDFKDVGPKVFTENPATVSKSKPFDDDSFGPHKGPGEVESGPARNRGRYKYTVKWTRSGKPNPIVKDPWIII